MSTVAKKGGLLSTLSSGISTCRSKARSYIVHEPSVVVNPDGSNVVEQDANERRLKVDQERESRWTYMHNFIGSDIQSMVTLPVIIFEPMTMLQKLAEIMEYSYLLDLADQCEDPFMKLAYASTWAVSVYFAYQRTWKPFNPILGETYEMIDKSGLTFLAEQVAFSLLVSLLRSLPRKTKVRDKKLFTTFCTVCLNSHFASFRFLNPRIFIYFLFFCFGALARMKIFSSCAIAIGMTR